MKGSKGYRVVAPDRYLRAHEEPRQVTVRHDGETLARSVRAVRLVEGDREEVLYLPRADVDGSRLVPSERTYLCRWKGEAAYFHVDLVDRTLENVVWGYPDAPESISALRDRVAFDPAVFEIDVGETCDANGVDDPPGGTAERFA